MVLNAFSREAGLHYLNLDLDNFFLLKSFWFVPYHYNVQGQSKFDFILHALLRKKLNVKLTEKGTTFLGYMAK